MGLLKNHGGSWGGEGDTSMYLTMCFSKLVYNYVGGTGFFDDPGLLEST